MQRVEHMVADKFAFTIFRDIFTQEELDLIWKEALYFCDESKLCPPGETGSAMDGDRYMKSNKGIWLDSVFSERAYSNYLKLYKKPFTEHNNMLRSFIAVDYTLNLFFNTTNDNTLMNYYEDSDFYEPHYDKSCYTYVFWLFKQPKWFEGGNLTLTDINYTIDVKSNMGVLFPSWASHAVDKISMPNVIPKFQGYGRFSFSTFLHIK